MRGGGDWQERVSAVGDRGYRCCLRCPSGLGTSAPKGDGALVAGVGCVGQGLELGLGLAVRLKSREWEEECVFM